MLTALDASATVVSKETHITFLNNAPIVDNGLTGTVTTYKSPNATSQDFSAQTASGYKTGNGTAVSSGTLFAPDINVANAGQWQATFTLSGLTGDLNFSAVQLATMGFTSGGDYQGVGNESAPKGTTADGSTKAGKYAGFTVEYSTDGTTWLQVGPTYSIDMIVPSSHEATATRFSMEGSSASYAAGDTVYLRVTTSQDYTPGTFAGLKGITLLSDVNLTDVSWSGGSGSWTEMAFGATIVDGGSAENYFTFGSGSFSATDRTISVTLDNVIAPGGVLIDAGEGNTYALSGTGGFGGSGILTVASGTLRLSTADNSVWTGSISLAEGASLELQSGSWNLSDRLSADSLGTLVLSGAASASVGGTAANIQCKDEAALTLTGGTYGGSLNGSGIVSVAGNASLSHFQAGFTGVWQINGGVSLTIAATATESGQTALSGSGTWEMLGSGTVTIAGAPSSNTIGNLLVGNGSVQILQDTAVSDLLSIRHNGTMTIGNGVDAVTVTTKRLRGADDNSGGKQSLTIARNANLVVTGGSNTDGDARNSSILLGHWTGSLEMTVEGTMTAELAKVYMTFSSNASGTKLVVAGTGTLNTLGISKDTFSSSTAAAGTVVLEDGARLNLGSAGLTKIASFEAGAATVGSFADAWSSNQNITLTSDQGVTFNTGKYDLNTASYSTTAGTNITLSGVLADAANIAGAITKTGVGTLNLQGANTYTGGTTVDQGTLALTGNGQLGSGALRVKNAEGARLTTEKMTVTARGGDASVSGLAAPVTANSTEWRGASDASPAQVSHAEIALTASDATYRFESIVMNDSLLSIQNASSVSLQGVTLGPGTKLSNTGNAALSVADSSLTLNKASLSQVPEMVPSGSAVSLNYDMAGAAVSGAFTLDFTNGLLREIAALSSEPVYNIQITLENVSAWNVAEEGLQWGESATWLQPGAVTVSQANGGTVISVAFNRAVPEPAAAAMGLFGFAGLLLRRRRKTRGR